MAVFEEAQKEEHVILRIREELARRRMARAQLADLAKISLSSLEKSLAGQRPMTDQTLLRIEKALGLHFPREAREQIAPEHLGAYARDAVSIIEGSYLTLRPSPKGKDALVAYETFVFWDHSTPGLRFRESGRADREYTQQGEIAFPHQSGLIYFITNAHGQQRLMTLSRRAIDGVMHGLLQTLQPLRGGRLQPVAMPIVLLPMEERFEKVRGVVSVDAGEFAELRALLDRVLDDDVAELLS